MQCFQAKRSKSELSTVNGDFEGSAAVISTGLSTGVIFSNVGFSDLSTGAVFSKVVFSNSSIGAVPSGVVFSDLSTGAMFFKIQPSKFRH